MVRYGNKPLKRVLNLFEYYKLNYSQLLFVSGRIQSEKQKYCLCLGMCEEGGREREI